MNRLELMLGYRYSGGARSGMPVVAVEKVIVFVWYKTVAVEKH
jgi:hypothetical protein